MGLLPAVGASLVLVDTAHTGGARARSGPKNELRRFWRQTSRLRASGRDWAINTRGVGGGEPCSCCWDWRARRHGSRNDRFFALFDAAGALWERRQAHPEPSRSSSVTKVGGRVVSGGCRRRYHWPWRLTAARTAAEGHFFAVAIALGARWASAKGRGGQLAEGV